MVIKITVMKIYNVSCSTCSDGSGDVETIQAARMWKATHIASPRHKAILWESRHKPAEPRGIIIGGGHTEERSA